MAFNDPALLTATANDVAFDEVFALPLERLGARRRHADRDQQLRQLAEHPARARDARGSMSMQIVTLTGMRADNRARALGDLNFYVPLTRYGWVECGPSARPALLARSVPEPARPTERHLSVATSWSPAAAATSARS